MDMETFKQYVETYGGNISRWPAHTRNEAELLSASREAAELLSQARQLDKLLDTVVEAPLSDAFRARLLAIPDTARKAYIIWTFSPYRPALTIAACALFGIVTGFSQHIPNPAAARDMALIFGPNDPTELAL